MACAASVTLFSLASSPLISACAAGERSTLSAPPKSVAARSWPFSAGISERRCCTLTDSALVSIGRIWSGIGRPCARREPEPPPLDDQTAKRREAAPRRLTTGQRATPVGGSDGEA